MKLKCLIVALCFIANTPTFSQKEVTASIYDIIRAAQSESPDYLIAEIRADNAKWRYNATKSILKPQLTFFGNLPSFNRSIDVITLPNGSPSFVSRSFMNNSIGIGLNQVIVATGGTVNVNTNLERIDIFNSSGGNTATYRSVPINISFQQPLFNFNPFKWDQESAKIDYEISKKRFVEDRENAAFNAVNNFFDLYVTELNLIAAQNNKSYLDTLAATAKGRFEVGRISETDLLQIQLSAKNADGQVAQLALNVQNKTETLRNFLGLKEEVVFDLLTPEAIADYIIDKEEAFNYAVKHRSQSEQFRLQLLNAERQVDFAQKGTGPNLSLNGGFGLSNSAPAFSDAFGNLTNQERISLGIDIPIADWGRTKSQREIAKSNLELTNIQIQQDMVSFEREIMVNVEQFQLKKNQLKLAEESLEIAVKRLDIAKKRYDVGKIDVTDLSIAINDELSSRQNYYSTLWELWRAHYVIRNLTLYDFVENSVLD